MKSTLFKYHAFNVPCYLLEKELVETYRLSTFWDGNIGRVYTGRPTKKDTKMTIRQFFIQAMGCPKANKELRCWAFYVGVDGCLKGNVR